MKIKTKVILEKIVNKKNIPWDDEKYYLATIRWLKEQRLMKYYRYYYLNSSHNTYFRHIGLIYNGCDFKLPFVILYAFTFNGMKYKLSERQYRMMIDIFHSYIRRYSYLEMMK